LLYICNGSQDDDLKFYREKKKVFYFYEPDEDQDEERCGMPFVNDVRSIGFFVLGNRLKSGEIK